MSLFKGLFRQKSAGVQHGVGDYVVVTVGTYQDSICSLTGFNPDTQEFTAKLLKPPKRSEYVLTAGKELLPMLSGAFRAIKTGSEEEQAAIAAAEALSKISSRIDDSNPYGIAIYVREDSDPANASIDHDYGEAHGIAQHVKADSDEPPSIEHGFGEGHGIAKHTRTERKPDKLERHFSRARVVEEATPPRDHKAKAAARRAQVYEAQAANAKPSETPPDPKENAAKRRQKRIDEQQTTSEISGTHKSFNDAMDRLQKTESVLERIKREAREFKGRFEKGDFFWAKHSLEKGLVSEGEDGAEILLEFVNSAGDLRAAHIVAKSDLGKEYIIYLDDRNLILRPAEAHEIRERAIVVQESQTDASIQLPTPQAVIGGS